MATNQSPSSNSGTTAVKDAIFVSPLTMPLKYTWEFQTDGSNSQVAVSGMLPFNGEDAFCIRVKYDEVNSSTDTRECKFHLTLCAIKLLRFGLKIKDVVANLRRIDTHNCQPKSFYFSNEISEDSSFELLSAQFIDYVPPLEYNIRNVAFEFEILLESRKKESISYNLRDEFLTEQLWKTCTEGRHQPDIIIETKDSSIKAHKAILAARSPVFAEMFTSGHVTTLNLDASSKSAEKFFKFLYTGTLGNASYADEQLLLLAKTYELDSLKTVCQEALKVKRTDVRQVITLLALSSKVDGPRCNSSPVISNNGKLMPEDCCIAGYSCEWLVDSVLRSEKKMESNTFYLGDYPLFSILLRPKRAEDDPPSFCHSYYNISIVVVGFACGVYSIEKMLFSCDLDRSNWNEMQFSGKRGSSIPTFVSTYRVSIRNNPGIYKHRFNFLAELSCKNFVRETVDVHWFKDMLNCFSSSFADVEIQCRRDKLPAHRVVLSSRSSVLAAQLSAMPASEKAILAIDAEQDTVKNFLAFLYTGLLPYSVCSGDHEELKQLASKYQVPSLSGLLSRSDSPSDVVLPAFSVLDF